MGEHEIGQKILDGILEIRAWKIGRGDLRTVKLSEPASPQEIRSRMN